MSKLSHHFTHLNASYQAELDDLRTDSEGNNILKVRLTQKRQQLPQLLAMMQFAPEMVAAAFHGAFEFKNTKTMESLITHEPNKFPAWNRLNNAFVIQPWAQALVDTVLTDSHGETFLITTAGLEYLHYHEHSHTVSIAADELEEQQSERENKDEEETEDDLDQAGANWLADQGFDRKE